MNLRVSSVSRSMLRRQLRIRAIDNGLLDSINNVWVKFYK